MKKVSRVFVMAAMVYAMAAAPVFGQISFSAGPGIGFPEFLNVGLRLHTGQSAIGVHIGAWPDRTSTVTSAGGGLAYHFAGQSPQSTLRPWYARSYVVYIRDESPDRLFQDVYLDTRVGRVFHFTPRVGMEADIGLGINLYNTFERTSPGFILDLSFPVIPTLGVRWFYRF